jgi:CDP-diacylglycerol--glycerol-3-phosphate 3-phosphatidyltransferase
MEYLRNAAQQLLEVALTPVARLLLRLGTTPNQISVAGVVLNVATAGLIVMDHFILAGCAYLVAGGLDMLDGLLARLAQRATPFGAFLDSTLDRISEGVVLSAIAYHFAVSGMPADASLVVLALLGSLLVSYTRARAEGLGARCKVGVFTRAERVLLVALGLLANMLAPVIYLLIALTALTVSQRILYTFRQLTDSKGRADVIT